MQKKVIQHTNFRNPFQNMKPKIWVPNPSLLLAATKIVACFFCVLVVVVSDLPEISRLAEPVITKLSYSLF